MKPYYDHSGIVIYHTDWRECELERHQLLLTDPPYGIEEARGKNKSRGKLALAKDYGTSDWDDAPPTEGELLRLQYWTEHQIIFGGNYFRLPPSKCWLVWDKVNSGDFADCELAWTNLDKAVRIFRYMWNGMLKENPEYRMHPTQKPLALMKWCLTQAPDKIMTVLDPYMGSGTTLLAAKSMGLSATGYEREECYCESAAIRLEQGVFEFGGANDIHT